MMAEVNFASTNYYFRLGLPRTATPEEVRRSFRNLARIYHPDVADNKTYAEEIFKRINEAYETLSDLQKRRIYDRDLSRLTGRVPTVNPFGRPASEPRPNPAPTQPPFRPYSGAANPFRTPPPSEETSQQSAREEIPQPRHRSDLDIEANLEISLEDAIQGATYIVNVQQNDLANRQQNLHTCRVHVPPGVYERQRLRLRGLGYVDHSAFCIGDLYLTVRYARHKTFKVLGTTLYTEALINPWEIALGSRLRLPTLDGLADLNVPPGTQPGSRVRVANQGLPQREGGRGDMMVQLHLRIPAATTDRERELWRALANAAGRR